MTIWIVYSRDKWMAEEWGLVCYKMNKENAIKVCRLLNSKRNEISKKSMYFTCQELTEKIDFEDLKMYLESAWMKRRKRNEN